ncbi:MAG: hypothetical protein ACYDDF_00210 [Thermoplasmatota archaeon]
MTKKFDAEEPSWGLFYREHTKDLEARKSIKVKLPIRQHIKLHAMKLFSENNISETVERALDIYFEKLKDAEEGTPQLSDGEAMAPTGLPSAPTNTGVATAASAPDFAAGNGTRTNL